MTRYSHVLILLAIPFLILSPFVQPEAWFAVWSAGTLAGIAGVLSYVFGD